jgi:hypothetical protein
LAFQLADGGRDVSGEDGRVRPLRVGERGRCHVLGPRVQRRRDGARICPYSPVAGKDLVGPPAEQERIGALVDLGEERLGLVVEERQGPSAALESAPAVLIRPAEALHHAVDRDVRGGRQFHGRREKGAKIHSVALPDSYLALLRQLVESGAARS